MRTTLLAAALAVFCLLPAATHAQRVGASSLAEAVDSVMRDTGARGIAVAVVEDG